MANPARGHRSWSRMSVRPGPGGSPNISGITDPSRSAQTSVTSGWLRDRAAARLAATRPDPSPAEAPMTTITWLPAPSEPASTWASSEKSRPVGDRGVAISRSGSYLLEREAHQHRDVEPGHVPRPADPVVAALGDERQHQAGQQPDQEPARDDEQQPGASCLLRRSGVADDRPARGIG